MTASNPAPSTPLIPSLPKDPAQPFVVSQPVLSEAEGNHLALSRRVLKKSPPPRRGRAGVGWASRWRRTNQGPFNTLTEDPAHDRL